MGDGILLALAVSVVGISGGAWILLFGSSEREIAFQLRVHKYCTNNMQNALLRNMDSRRHIGDIFPSYALMLKQAHLKISLSRLLGGIAGMGLVLFVLFHFVLNFDYVRAAVMALLLSFALPYLILKFIAQRRCRTIVRQLPPALDLIVRSLEAGHPITVAFGLVAKEMKAPISEEFQILVDEVRYGIHTDDALRGLAERVPSSEVRFLLVAVQIQRVTGGNLIEVLTNISAVIRDRFNLENKAKALAAQGKWSGIIVGAIPIVVGGIIYYTRPSYFLEVSDEPVFITGLFIAVGLMALGTFLIWRLTSFRA